MELTEQSPEKIQQNAMETILLLLEEISDKALLIKVINEAVKKANKL